MKDFQDVLKSLMESESPNPGSFDLPPAKVTKVEDAKNASEAFGAFANEHKKYYSVLKQAISTAEQQLDTLHQHSVSFNRSMAQRPDPASFQMPAARPKFDRSRVAALQQDLSNIPQQQKPMESFNVIEAEGNEVKTSDFIKTAKDSIAAALMEYDQGMKDLFKRTKVKMAEFASQSTGMAANQEELERKVQELQSNFSDASREVVELSHRVKSLEAEGRPEDRSKLAKLSSEISNLGQALEKKRMETEELSKSFGQVAGRASEEMQAMLDKIDELERADDEMRAEFQKLQSAYASLHKRAKQQQMITTPENVKNYGKFDLMEHLTKSKQNQKKNASDW